MPSISLFYCLKLPEVLFHKVFSYSLQRSNMMERTKDVFKLSKNRRFDCFSFIFKLTEVDKNLHKLRLHAQIILTMMFINNIYRFNL